MAQLSRPYQIGLAVLVVAAAAWFVALRPHSSNSSESVPPPAPAAKAATSSAGGSGGSSNGSSSVYHGSAPGVEGLSSAIAKAHGAVTTSQQNAKQLEEHSAQASSESPSSEPSSSAAAAGSPTTNASSPSTSASGAAAAATDTSTKSPGATTQPAKNHTGAKTPARQPPVEKALHEGKIAVILFWSPKGADDTAVRKELRTLEAVHGLIPSFGNVSQVRAKLAHAGLEVHKPLAAFTASSSEVAAFGTVTRGIQVYGTPTLLIVGRTGQATVLTGLTDALAIEQAVDETRHA